MTPSAETADRPRWRMPAEWETHERCLIAWPTRADLWDSHFEEAKREFAATANDPTAIGSEPHLDDFDSQPL